MIPNQFIRCKGISFIFAKDVAEVLDAALQPMDAPKAEKPKSGVRLKTMETAPPSAGLAANMPSMA
jgi:hypothetical protein